LELLTSHEVEYLVVGGYAVGYHGYPRATVDLDIWIAVSEATAHKLVQTLKDFGFDAPELVPELFLRERKVIRMGAPPVRLEILTSIDGVDFETCYARRVVGQMDGVTLNLISLEDLKRNKRASGRAKDLADLEELP
jgi:hypothetical protein